MDYTVPGILQARILGWVAIPSPGDLSNLGIKPRSPALQVDSLSAEAQGKPQNTGMVSLSFLQRIFLIQELNQGVLHCRQILYQLRYEGSPTLLLYSTEIFLELSLRLRLCFVPTIQKHPE